MIARDCILANVFHLCYSQHRLLQPAEIDQYHEETRTLLVPYRYLFLQITEERLCKHFTKQKTRNPTII